MTNKKWLLPILPYIAVVAGMYLFKNAWVALLGFHASILLMLAIVHPNIPINILFKSKSPKWILISVLVCGTSGFGLYFLWNMFGITPDLSAQLGSMGLKSSTSWLLFITYFSLVNPFIEEYFWRGYLGSNSKKLYIGDACLCGLSWAGLMGQGASSDNSIGSYWSSHQWVGFGGKYHAKMKVCLRLCWVTWLRTSQYYLSSI